MNRTVLNILVASPSDTASERQVISEVIADWNSAHANTSQYILHGLCWERDSVPGVGSPPQEILNRQLADRADIVIAVFFSRLGTPTNEALSGTVEEIERAKSAGKPVLIYFSKALVPHNLDPQQLQSLREYKKRLGSESLFAEFTTVDDLRRLVTRHLAATIAALEIVESSPWMHYNGRKTSAHNGQQVYERSVSENHISHSLPAPYTDRSEVEAIAQHSRRMIPIDSLTALPDQQISPRGAVFFGNPGKYIDQVLENYPDLEWWFSDRGLNITRVSSS